MSAPVQQQSHSTTQSRSSHSSTDNCSSSSDYSEGDCVGGDTDSAAASKSPLPAADPTSRNSGEAPIVVDDDDDDALLALVAGTAEVAERPKTPPLPDPLPMLAEMFPDADEDYLEQMLGDSLMAGLGTAEAVEAVAQHLFTSKDAYPRRRGRKRKHGSEGIPDGDGADKPRESKSARIDGPLIDDYRDVTNTPPSIACRDACEALLLCDFPKKPWETIIVAMQDHNAQYIPTYLFLQDQPDVLRHSRHNTQVAQGKAEAKVAKVPELAAEVEALRRWLTMKESNLLCEIECGCCYGEFDISGMVQCEDGHLFCRECARRNAEVIIGNQRTELKCMSADGCKFSFSVSETKLFLPETSFELWMRLRAENDIKKAMDQLKGFEECPFCNFGMVVEADKEIDKLFRCQNLDCGRTSCRLCKRDNHVPLSCEEVRKDLALDAQHLIEEAMTEALVRICPGCKNKFYKEEGCNKMTCVKCHTISCYVCRKSVTDYRHFSDRHNNEDGKCPLYDSTVRRHHNEVVQAREEALRNIQGLVDEDVDITQINVDAPEAPPAPVQPQRPPGGPMQHHQQLGGRAPPHRPPPAPPLPLPLIFANHGGQPGGHGGRGPRR